MAFFALGINHRTAPVDIRERVAFSPQRLESALQALLRLPTVEESAILSTCNRTELYCYLEQQEIAPVIDWLAAYHHLPKEQFEPYIYQYSGQEGIRHLLRVASGLDSMVLGEPQILGQMKEAYQAASSSGSATRLLGRLFQHTFSVAKQVRTDTAIGASPVSVAYAAVSLARQIFGDLGKHTALLIGAGETIELATRHLHEHSLGRMIIANRTLERAHNLAAEFDGFAIGLDEIPAHLAEADIVISSTASQQPILRQGEVREALHKRKHRPILMVDIAVPRDIEPQVGELDDIYLYSVDDLQEVIADNLRSRQEAASQAEEIIEVQAAHFIGWLKSLDAVNTISAIRGQAESYRQEVLDKARRQLSQGKDPEQVLEFLANTLTNKLLHAPSSQLRQAGFDGRPDIIEVARTLFDLDHDTDDSNLP